MNLERVTLAWNVARLAVLAAAAAAARSVALADYGLDSLVEIGASTAALLKLSDSSQPRQRTALAQPGDLC